VSAPAAPPFFNLKEEDKILLIQQTQEHQNNTGAQWGLL
jgi:hypothetical protein